MNASIANPDQRHPEEGEGPSNQEEESGEEERKMMMHGGSLFDIQLNVVFTNCVLTQLAELANIHFSFLHFQLEVSSLD